MNCKKILAVILCTVMVCSLFTVSVSALSEYNGLLYETNDSFIEVVGTDEDFPETQNLIVPSSIKGMTVTKIGQNAFARNARISGFTFSNSLLNISENAMFAMPNLTEVTLPKGLTNLGRSAFSYCASLQSVTFMTTSLSLIKKYTFFNCPSLERVVLSKSIFQLDEHCFGNCSSLTKIYIPLSVKNISDTAFENSDNVTIYGVEGSAAFSYAQSHNIPFVVVNSADYSSLDSLISKTKIKLADNAFSAYTEDTVEILRNTYLMAVDVRNDILSSQTDVDNALLALQNAYQTLFPLRLVALRDTLTTAKTYVLSHYTVDTAQNLQNAITYAENLIAVSSTNENDIQSAINDLSTAVSNLQGLLKGDIDTDGQVKLKDAVLVQRYLLDTVSFDERMTFCADFNNDGSVTLADIILIQRYVIRT